uniref:Coiled-coil domain-containing protein 39 n=1 Tax=Angiostrongylus cantonensis TaxID=6313 RepID=A0A158P8F6_ANGCA
MIKRSDACVTLADSQCATPRWSSLSVEEFSGMSVGQPSFATPCGPNRRRISSVNMNFHTVARCGGSPLMDTINSPKVRELRREREIKALRRQLNEIEDQLMNSESQVSESTTKIESLIGEIAKKNERIRSLESSGKLSQRSQEELEAKVVVLTKQLEGYKRQCDNQKERLAAYKVNVEELEEKQMVLGEQLETKGGSMAVLEAELRNVKDEAVKSLQQVRILDNERNTLIRLLEEERRAAKSEREQYQGAISDWRKRLETETANAMSLYTNEMEKNALLQQEIREKTEKFERTRILYESDKRSCENAIEEIKRRLQGKHNAAMKSLAQAKAKLFRQEARHKKFVSEHEAVVQQLESVHLAEIVQRDAKINAACIRIEELEAIVVDREHTILELRKDLANITAEKDATDSKLSSVQIVLEEKEDRLIEATIMIEKLKEDMGSITSKYNDLMGKLMVSEDRIRHHAGALSLLEERSKSIRCVEQTNEEFSDEAYGQLHENITVKRRDLLALSMKCNALLSIIFFLFEIIDELKSQIEYLSGKTTASSNCFYTPNFNDISYQTELREAMKSLMKSDTSINIDSCTLPTENLELLKIEELQFCSMETSHGELVGYYYQIITDKLLNPFSILGGEPVKHANHLITRADTYGIFVCLNRVSKPSTGVNSLNKHGNVARHDKAKEIEDKSAASCVPSSVYNGLQPSHQNDSSNIASRSNSVASSIHSGVGRSASMPKSNSSKLPSVESYALEAKHCANLDIDRSGVNELQRKSASTKNTDITMSLPHFRRLEKAFVSVEQKRSWMI